MMFDTYKDVISQIDIVELAIENYRNEIIYLGKLAKINGPSDIKGIDYSAIPVKGCGQLGYLDYLERVKKIESHILLHEERLKYLNNCKECMEKDLEKLDRKQYKVYYKKYVEGKKSWKIAEEMNMSDRQIMRILKKIKENCKMS